MRRNNKIVNTCANLLLCMYSVAIGLKNQPSFSILNSKNSVPEVKMTPNLDTFRYIVEEDTTSYK